MIIYVFRNNNFGKSIASINWKNILIKLNKALRKIYKQKFIQLKSKLFKRL